ncbi:diguanylate cyclase (GGDEF) domain-containing protein [Desulfuromusa kysingii]|uniref:diguanylate cyclase n=1 Tax=Desulfuromusa kysingii TaxID=37625 RepID=A0A1H4BMV3_9BACT|nr:sensor domain-containing diguanylate cyclase [Desulfuromusa kysingii]SEA49384.1 diguanylate cyclase (GGDEF) domain-containing protein [Desulfuromusa kysingii]
MQVIKNIKFHSVALFLFWVLLIGLLVPITVGMIITLDLERTKLKNELSVFHHETLKTLVESTEDAMLSFSPDGVSNTVRFLLRDERIVSIEVFSDIFDLYLMKVSKEIPEHEIDSSTLRQIVSKDRENLGFVQITVDNGWIVPKLKQEHNIIIILFAAMFFCALLLVIPSIHFKILRPLQRLKKQAEVLSSGDLSIVCEWQGRDELTILGQTLEAMRSKLNENFNAMKEMAVTDDLTGLPNRREFYTELKILLNLSSRYNHQLSIAIFDIDYFKNVNDTYGHGIGDEVLKELSQLVAHKARKTDLLARIGGEEFAIVLPETSVSVAGRLLNELRTVVSGWSFPHGEKLTVSIGVTGYSGVESIEQLMETADKALYEAKEQGRDRVVIH